MVLKVWSLFLDVTAGRFEFGGADSLRTFLLQRGALSLEGLLEFGRDGMLCFGAQIRGDLAVW